MDRWLQISRVFHEARERPAEERAVFLAAACGDDVELRAEVESLLASAEAGGIGAFGALTATDRRRLRAGERLSHYHIIDRLGAGGMGEVYRARDERLDRDVAIKVLPAQSFDDPAARARLLREAKAAAALNHPHICTVHEVGEANGQTFIAMELVEGQTLSERLAAGPLPPADVVGYGMQLAEALAHAHARGIVHRDFKSANIIVTVETRVKVLDFGLARRLSTADLSELMTRADVTVTQPGVIAGTLAYMAPEQLRGEMAQTTSDVWALGVVLYEMAEGSRPFDGQTSFEVTAAILNQPPAPFRMPMPPALQGVILRCLEKDPARRYQSAGDVRLALQSGHAAAQPSTRAEPRVIIMTRRQALSAVSAAVVAAGGFAAWFLLGTTGPVRTLAVLPFANPGNDADLEYLCDGVAESLIEQVQTLPAFSVTTLSAALNFKGPAVDPRAAGRELGVESVLTGSVQRQDARLVISAELLDVASGTSLWSSTFDRDSSELLEVEEEIVRAVVDDALRMQLTEDERQTLIRMPTRDGDAYDLYLQARHIQRRATEDDYLLSRELLQRAVARDPNFALALAAISGSYAMMVTDGLERPTYAWPQVSKFLRSALAIDPQLAEAHGYAHAIAFLFDWDWAGADEARRRLLALPPHEIDPQLLRSIAAERWALGHVDEALALAQRAREQDPLSAYLAIIEADYLFQAGKVDAAINLYQRTASREPDNPNLFFGLSEALAQVGRFDDALDARRRAHELAGDDRLQPLLSKARGEQGYRDVDQAWVRLQLDALKEREGVAYVSPLDFARVYAQLGEKELAFKYLDAAFEDRSPGLVFLKVDRAWNSIRDDPRFVAAIARVGLP
jgi:TolB-like protein/tRNA A-37 threonylcarbamoyl transferase component Bud32